MLYAPKLFVQHVDDSFLNNCVAGLVRTAAGFNEVNSRAYRSSIVKTIPGIAEVRSGKDQLSPTRIDLPFNPVGI